MTDMGAMTPAEIGQYSKGWAGVRRKRKKKKVKKEDPEAIRNAHLNEVTAQMRLEAARLEALENFNQCHGANGRFCSTGGGGGSVGGGSSGSSIHKETSDINKFIEQRDKMPDDLRAFLTPYNANEYSEKGAKAYLAKDGKSGYVIAEDGDLISVFSHPGAHRGMEILNEAIANGATKLDCMGLKLRDLYISKGFKVTKVDKWNDDYKPKNWNDTKYGKPDIFYMELKK